MKVHVLVFWCLLSVRRSRLEMLYKRGAFKNFAKFLGKQLCKSLSIDKVADLYNQILLTNSKIFHGVIL